MTELGVSSWHAITQESVDAFADVSGLIKLRFPAPLLVGDRVRLCARLDDSRPLEGGLLLEFGLTFEPEGGGKPVCVASALYRVMEEEA